MFLDTVCIYNGIIKKISSTSYLNEWVEYYKQHYNFYIDLS